MASNVGIDGLASGLDTTSLINNLMSLEAAPQNALRTRLTSTNTVSSALQAMNTKVASLTSSAKDFASSTSFAATKGTSSDATTATVSSSAGAAEGSLSFEVTALASAHSLISTVMTDQASAPTLTFSKPGTSATTTVTPASGSLKDIAAAITASAAGVTATLVNDGAGQRMLLTSTATGGASQFDVTGLGSDPLVQLKQGRDATIELGSGVVLSSPTNTFTGLLTGVDVTVAKISEPGKMVTAAVAKDPTAAKTKIDGLMASLSVVFSEIVDRTKTSTDAAVKPGPLVGNAAVRELRLALSDAGSGFVDVAGVPTPVGLAGIELKRDGTISLDATKFAALMKADPVKAEAIVNGFAAKVAAAGKAASDASTGSLSQAVTAQNDAAKDLTTRISDWDSRLELRRSTLQLQFTNLETALSKMKSQSTYLAGALANL